MKTYTKSNIFSDFKEHLFSQIRSKYPNSAILHSGPPSRYYLAIDRTADYWIYFEEPVPRIELRNTFRQDTYNKALSLEKEVTQLMLSTLSSYI